MLLTRRHFQSFDLEGNKERRYFKLFECSGPDVARRVSRGVSVDAKWFYTTQVIPCLP